MNKSVGILICVAVFLIIGGASIYVFLQNNSSNESVNSNSSGASDLNDNSQESGEMAKAGNTTQRYLEFENGLIENTPGKKLLFFYANWCPTCRPVDKELQENSEKIPEEITIIRVNYNDPDTDQAEKDLAKKYNVTYQHTFVLIDENGNEIKKWNGGEMDKLLSELN